MAHTFEELVHKRRAADLAKHRVEELRDSYGPPTQHRWTPRQSETYETAVRAWRDLDRDARTAMAEYVKEGGQSRHKIEAKLRKAVQDDDRTSDRPGPAPGPGAHRPRRVTGAGSDYFALVPGRVPGLAVVSAGPP